jgi:broad specificity phosphatase PhoE
MDLVLARHGQSEWNVDRSAGPDSPLTELGFQQAERLGAWLAGRYTFTTLYTSPLLRARQTAEVVNQHLGLSIVFDKDLRESDSRYEHPRPARPVPGLGAPVALTPSYAAFYCQVSQAVRRIVGAEPAGTTLVIGHAGTIGTFVRTLLGTHSLLVGTQLAATHHLRWDDGRWVVAFLNRTDYLTGIEEG